MLNLLQHLKTTQKEIPKQVRNDKNAILRNMSYLLSIVIILFLIRSIKFQYHSKIIVLSFNRLKKLYMIMLLWLRMPIIICYYKLNSDQFYFPHIKTIVQIVLSLFNHQLQIGLNGTKTHLNHLIKPLIIK